MIFEDNDSTKTRLREGLNGRHYLETPPNEGLAVAYEQEAKRIDARILEMRGSDSLRVYREIRNDYRARGEVLPERHQKKRDEKAAELRKLRNDKRAASEKAQRFGANSKVDISPSVEKLYKTAGTEMPDATHKALSNYTKSREARGIPKAKLVREPAKHSPKADMPRVRERRSQTKPRNTGGGNAPRGNASGGGSSSDGDGGSGDSDPDQPEPPAPVARAQTVHPLNPDKKHKPRYRNGRPSYCWRVSRNTCGTQREGGRAA
jgi:hypothetical protein